MLKALILKELQNNVLSMRFLFAFIIVVAIMLGSTSVLIDDYTNAALDYRANETASRHLIKDAESWWSLQWDGVQVVRPLTPLQAFIVGAEHNQDPVAEVFDKSQPLIRFFGSLERNPLESMLPAVDIMFIVGVVLSLITLVLSFDMISGERADGTLKLLLSFPVPRSVLIFAKWMGGYITLSIPFLVGYLAIAIWFQLSSMVRLSSGEWLAFLGIGLASLLYIAWMFSASLLVSCWCRRSATAMSILLFFWVVLVLVVPNLTPYFAARAVPVESVQSVRFQGMKTAKEIQAKESEDLNALEEKYKVRRWWEGDAWLEAIEIFTEGHNRQRQATRAVVDKREARVRKQTALAQSLGRISPLASYAQIVTALSWTGLDFERHLRTVMREYEDRIRVVVSDNMRDGHAFVPEKIPYFNYTPPSVGSRLAATLYDWAVLMTGTVVLFLGAFVSFVIRDVI